MSSIGPLPPGYKEVDGKVVDATGRRITATEVRKLQAQQSGLDTESTTAWKRGSKGQQWEHRKQWWGASSSWSGGASGTGSWAASSSSWHGAAGTERRAGSWRGDEERRLIQVDGEDYWLYYNSGWYEKVEGVVGEEEGGGDGATGTGEAKEEEAEEEAEEEDAVGAAGTGGAAAAKED